VRRNLLGANSLEESLHVVHIGHVDRASIGVVGVYIASLHVGHARLVVVVSAVLSLVLGLNTIRG